MAKKNMQLILILTFLVFPQYSISQTNQMKLAKLIYSWHAKKVALIEQCGIHYKESSHKLEQAKSNYLKLNQKEINDAKMLLGNKSADLIKRKINVRYTKLPKEEARTLLDAQACNQRVVHELKTSKPNLFRLRWKDGLKKVSGAYLRTCLYQKYNKMYADRYQAMIKSDYHMYWRPPKGLATRRCTVKILQNKKGKVLKYNFLECENKMLKKSVASVLSRRRLPKAPCKEVFSPSIKFTFY